MRLPVSSEWLGRQLARSTPRGDAELSLPAARTALAAHLKASGVTGPSDPRDAQQARQAVRALCDDAHRCHLHAEQLLIVIKDAWREMPEARVGSGHVAPHDSLDRFISLCIEEYYARRD
jgi:hypothetical protein